MTADTLGALLSLAPAARFDWYASLTHEEARAIAFHWPLWARPGAAQTTTRGAHGGGG